MHARHPAGGPTRPVLLGAAAVAIALAACSKEEPRAARPASAVPVAAPSAAPAPTNAPEAPEGLKERLARQEAAAKLFDKARVEAPPPAPPVAAPAAAKTPPPPAAKPAPAPAPTPVVEPPRVAAAPASARPAEPKPAEARPAPPAPAAASPAQAPVPRTDLAAAKPSASASVPARLVTRVDPDFPREAIQAGADRGQVKARMTLDAEGNVTRVDVVEAQPRRHFDRAVVRALSQWKFSEGAAGRIVETEVEFRR